MNINWLSFGDMVTQYFLELPAEIYSSILIAIAVGVFAIVIGNKMKKADPLARPSTAVLLGETIVGGIEGWTMNMGGPRMKGFAPYFCAVAIYLPISFISGMLALPSPVGYYAVPLIFALVTFISTHAVAFKYQKWSYFKRFTSPFAVFLPINILTFPANAISLSFRMFGNALAGTIILSMVYWATGNITEMLFNLVGLGNFNFIAPFITPFLHAYFDLFGALIQTLVFLSLSVLFISAEIPSEVDA